MKHITEINHCIPNPKAYWCISCKCHSSFTFRKASGQPYDHADWFVCDGCKNPMILPNKRLKLLYVFVLLTVVFLLNTFLNSWDPYASGFRAIFNPGNSFLASFLSGSVSAVLFLGVTRWLIWSYRTNKKTSSELIDDALNHPFQPEFRSDKDFYKWLNQFLTQDEFATLLRKHGGKTGEELKAEGK